MAGCPVNGCQWHGGTDAEFLAHLKLVAKEFRGEFEPHKELLAEKEPRAVKKDAPVIAPPPAPQVQAPSTK